MYFYELVIHECVELFGATFENVSFMLSVGDPQLCTCGTLASFSSAWTPALASLLFICGHWWPVHALATVSGHLTPVHLMMVLIWPCTVRYSFSIAS